MWGAELAGRDAGPVEGGERETETTGRGRGKETGRGLYYDVFVMKTSELCDRICANPIVFYCILYTHFLNISGCITKCCSSLMILL